ncbi:Hypp1316 [Branchiostoma lanceolatum]|uniref:Hypp1316 protein n=1 Tax=Branchiostoma lanceolatum TaxID=7740 RepID=A0A8J9ZGD4_BRALA|nr:Hypp1316 [Branchiostoma lanceolatum]
MKGRCSETFGWDSILGCRPCSYCVTWPDDPHCWDCPLPETTTGQETAVVATSASWSSTMSGQEGLWTTAAVDGITSTVRELLTDLPGPSTVRATLETVGFDEELTWTELTVVALLSGLLMFLMVLLLLSCVTCGVRVGRRWGNGTSTATLRKTPGEEVTCPRW